MPVPASQESTAVTVRWVGWLLLACALLLLPWTAYLFVVLPDRALSANFSLAWGGFDLALAASLAWTAWNAIHPTRWLSAAASSTATMVVVDAWFDVITAPGPRHAIPAMLMAVFVELPLAAACFWLSVHGQQLRDGSLVMRMRRNPRRVQREIIGS